MILTLQRRTALARMSDGEWRLGADITEHGSVLGVLERMGYIRRASGGFAGLYDYWTITPSGIAALEATE
jgi:DNA-binding MarR family transcriptional regulator